MSLLEHAHVATVTNRLAPGAEECAGIQPFFEALVRSGYKGTISIEGGLPDMEKDLRRGLALMKELATRR